MKVILITGGAGFIGSNFIRFFLRRNKNFIIVNMDSLNHATNLENVKDLEKSPRYHFVKGSITNHELVNYVIKRHRPDYIINFASESNFDNCASNPLSFTQTHMLGTQTLLESARYFWGKHKFQGNLFIQASINEVYGSTPANDVFFSEDAPLLPDNPFSASKAGADMLVKSYASAYGFPAIITRCCPTYGPYQHIGNFVPKCIINALSDKPVPVFEKKVREWIYVLDHCIALIRVLFYGKTGEIYNISSGNEISDFDMAKKILELLGKPKEAIERIDDSSLQNTRCILNSYKLKNNLNWSTKFKLEDGLRDTILWYKQNPDRWKDIEL
ncbi:MAG TPA: GDP-mannose 4,6-dehydratase [Acetivibrio sp.]|uniref:dTDP-glucose 4,6-dehydratase n=1 Tax=Acetivibrio sp. TaxID=1872092 RepID=UPI002C019F02|nr:GDP-mannose 4,6-dehydratase [Acetivibrio sp.]HOM01424.1 GDP-mannose 4,6-dehydratase [Acetivibrio sp.]